jgi:hypothetical protein
MKKAKVCGRGAKNQRKNFMLPWAVQQVVLLCRFCALSPILYPVAPFFFLSHKPTAHIHDTIGKKPTHFC